MCMFLLKNIRGALTVDRGFLLRSKFQVASPLESKVGPMSRILNQTWPEPSNVSAVPGALAIYLRSECQLSSWKNWKGSDLH